MVIGMSTPDLAAICRQYNLGATTGMDRAAMERLAMSNLTVNEIRRFKGKKKAA